MSALTEATMTSGRSPDWWDDSARIAESRLATVSGCGLIRSWGSVSQAGSSHTSIASERLRSVALVWSDSRELAVTTRVMPAAPGRWISASRSRVWSCLAATTSTLDSALSRTRAIEGWRERASRSFSPLTPGSVAGSERPQPGAWNRCCAAARPSDTTIVIASQALSNCRGDLVCFCPGKGFQHIRCRVHPARGVGRFPCEPARTPGSPTPYQYRADRCVHRGHRPASSARPPHRGQGRRGRQWPGSQALRSS